VKVLVSEKENQDGYIGSQAQWSITKLN